MAICDAYPEIGHAVRHDVLGLTQKQGMPHNMVYSEVQVLPAKGRRYAIRPLTHNYSRYTANHVNVMLTRALIQGTLPTAVPPVLRVYMRSTAL